MACAARVSQLLEKGKRPYQVIEHRPSSDAEGVAQTTHVRARMLAQVVVVRERPGVFHMLVIPSCERLDLETAHRVIGVPNLTFASPAELKRLFPDCEPGALPPFGALYGMPAVLDLCFFEEEEGEEDGQIYFEAGNHRELVTMKFEDFRRLAGPFAHEACLHHRPEHPRTVKHGGRGGLH